MSVSIRLKLTFFIFIIGLIGSIGAFVTANILEVGTPYPFFSWKLYSQPLGSNNTFTEYRIYARFKNDVLYKRQQIKTLKDFSTDEYIYTFNHLIEKTLQDSLHQTNYKKKLFSFVKHVVPDATNYKIVSETYHPKSLLTFPAKYDTITVIHF